MEKIKSAGCHGQQTEGSLSSRTLMGNMRWEVNERGTIEEGKTERGKEEKCCFALRPGPPLAHDSLQMKCHPGRQ